MPQSPQLSVQEFAARVKDKFPQYRDMDNLDLARQLVNRYPEYRDVVRFPPAPLAFTNPLGPGSAGYGPIQQAQEDRFNLKPLPYSFTDLVDPEAPEFGGPVSSSIHPDTRGGRNLVPRQIAPQVNQEMQYEAAHPEEQRNEYLNSGLSLRERMAANMPLHARTVLSQTQEMEAAKNWLQEKGGDIGADVFESVVSHPTAEPFGGFYPNQANPETKYDLSPEVKGIVRGAGRFAGAAATDPTTYALMGLAPEGQLGRALMGLGFAGQMAEGSYHQAGQLGKIWDRDDIPREQKIELGTQLVLNTVLAGTAGAHAVRAPFLLEHPMLQEIPPADRAEVAQRITEQLPASKIAPMPGTTASEVSLAGEKSLSGVYGVGDDVARVPPLPPIAQQVQLGVQARLKDLHENLQNASSVGEVQHLNSDIDRQYDILDGIERTYGRNVEPLTGFPLQDDPEENPSQPDKPPPNSNSPKLITDYLPDFKNFIEETRSDKTAYQYSKGLERFFNEFPEHSDPGKFVGPGFSSDILDNFKQRRLAVGASPSSINTTASVLKSFRDWLAENMGAKLDDTASSLTLRDLKRRLPQPQPERLSDSMTPQDVLNGIPEFEDSVIGRTEPDSPPTENRPAQGPLSFNDLRRKLLSQASEEEETAPQQISSAKARSIERAKETYKQNHTINSLVEYGNATRQISELQAKLDLAQRAQEKGFPRGAKSQQDMEEMEQQLQELRGDAQHFFSEHAKGLTDEETQQLIEGVEKPVYKQIGQALQLHRLLKDDVAAKALKQALIEDVSDKGLSMESRARLREILGDEKFGPRLTKGPGSQRTRIYDKLGYTISPEQTFFLLKFPPRGPRAAEILEKVDSARSMARELAEVESDPKRKAYYQSLFERYEPNEVDQQPQVPASVRSLSPLAQLKRTGELVAAGGEIKRATLESLQRLNIVKSLGPVPTDVKGFSDFVSKHRNEISNSIRQYVRAESTRTGEVLPDTVVGKPGTASKAVKRLGEYKRYPILVNPRVHGAPAISTSDFFHANLPGEIQEINLRNLAAILGKERLRSKVGELSADQKNLLKDADPDLRRQFKAEFARERVQKLRDEFIADAKKKLQLVRAVKQARGIPADHLTPLETKVAAAIAAVRGKGTNPVPIAGTLKAAHDSK